MKKLGLVLFFVLAAMVSNAQLFVGGSVGLNLGSDKVKVGNNTPFNESSFGFGLSPRIGYYLNDKFAIGAMVNLQTTSDKDKSDSNIEIKDTEFAWGITPFARYSFVEFGKFSVMAEGRLGIGGSTSKSKVGNTTIEDPSTFNYGFNISPILSYSLSDRINLEAALNFLNFGLNGTSEKHNDTDRKDTTFDFGIGVNSRDAFNVGRMTVGFIYKF